MNTRVKQQDLHYQMGPAKQRDSNEFGDGRDVASEQLQSVKASQLSTKYQSIPQKTANYRSSSSKKGLNDPSTTNAGSNKQRSVTHHNIINAKNVIINYANDNQEGQSVNRGEFVLPQEQEQEITSGQAFSAIGQPAYY